jgi:hypothetical protein
MRSHGVPCRWPPAAPQHPGVATIVHDKLASRNRPSFYADPLAWAIADFVEPFMQGRSGDGVSTGLIVVSDICSLRTIQTLSATAAKGSVSPLRFAGASPSIVAGLAALCHGLRGPTIVLTMRPAAAHRAASAQIRFWLRDSRVSAAILVAHHPMAGGGDLLRGAILENAAAGMEGTIRAVCETVMEPDS